MEPSPVIILLDLSCCFHSAFMSISSAKQLWRVLHEKICVGLRFCTISQAANIVVSKIERAWMAFLPPGTATRGRVRRRCFAVFDSFAHFTSIYRVVAEEIRWGAVSPTSSWSIPLFRADFLCFTLKFVEHSRYLLD